MAQGLGRLDSTFTGESGVANRLITAFGGTATISYQTGETYNKETMQSSGASTTSYELPASPPSPFKKSEINGSSVLDGDLMTYIAAFQTPEEPQVNASYTYNGTDFTITMVKPITSGNMVAAYKLGVRRVGQ